jgi:predicted small integral membrane protein
MIKLTVEIEKIIYILLWNNIANFSNKFIFFYHLHKLHTQDFDHKILEKEMHELCNKIQYYRLAPVLVITAKTTVRIYSLINETIFNETAKSN